MRIFMNNVTCACCCISHMQRSNHKMCHLHRSNISTRQSAAKHAGLTSHNTPGQCMLYVHHGGLTCDRRECSVVDALCYMLMVCPRFKLCQYQSRKLLHVA